MKKSGLFYIIPLMVVALFVVVLLWIYSATDLFYSENYKIIDTIIGVFLIILGIYCACVIFLSADESDRESFADLLKQIGGVIGTGIAGLMIYNAGVYFLSGLNSLSTMILYDIMMYGNYAVAIICLIGTIKMFKPDEWYSLSIRSKIVRPLVVVCSVVGLANYIGSLISGELQSIDYTMLVLSLTIFVVNLAYVLISSYFRDNY